MAQKQKDLSVSFFDVNDRYLGHRALLESKSQSTLLEEQILAVALNKAQHFKKKSANGEYIVSFRQGELKKLLKCTSNTIYERSKEAVEAIRTRAIYWEEPKTKQFAFINLISRGHYNDAEQKLEIYFNSALDSVINPIRDCWTPLYLSTMLSWKKQGAFRLYEIARSKCFVPKMDHVVTDTFIWRVNINELRYLLGYVDIEEPKVKRYLNSVNVPDYDKAFQLQSHKKYATWSSFKRVIDTAINEINASAFSEITLSYDMPKGTRGAAGKISAIEFTIIRKNCVIDEENLEFIKKNMGEAEIDDFVDSILEDVLPEMSFKLKIKDIKAIADKAAYDKERIIKAFKIADQASNVRDLVGYIITAIEENWDLPVSKGNLGDNKTKKKESKKKNQFTDFEQRDYDFEELEKKLRSN